MPLMVACAYGLRTTCTHSIPGIEMLSTNRPWPVMSSGSSLRSWRWPMAPDGTSVVAMIAS